MKDSKDNLIYEKKILIRSEQVDMTRKLRMSELFRLMEEASIAHTEELGCTREKTLDRGLLWIITRQEAEIEELPAYDEEITVRSWQGDMMHVFFPRFYEIERAGRIIVRGRALWVLIEEAARQIAMPEDYGIFIPGRPGSEGMMLQAVIIPKSLRDGADSSAAAGDSAKAAGSGLMITDDLVTGFSQVDINGHMNNTRYFDIIDDALYRFYSSCPAGDTEDDDMHAGSPHAWEKATPHLVRANYLSELRAGDAFTLRGYRSGSEGASGSGEAASTADAGVNWYFEGADGDKVKFRISCEYQQGSSEAQP